MRLLLPKLFYLASVGFVAVVLGDQQVLQSGEFSAARGEDLPNLNRPPARVGIPYLIQNHTAQPWLRLETLSSENRVSPQASCPELTPSNPLKFWYEQITHNGESSFMDGTYKANYKVFRNVVTDFQADNTGKSDASAAIQRAIAAGASNGPDRTSDSMGTTGQPAVVYLPGGTYLMTGSLQLYVGTVLIGDPLNPPVLKAAQDFQNDHIIYAKDPHHDGTINFYIAVKNIVIDSTSVDKSRSLTLIDWTVSQATQITNVVFKMPNFSTGHIGLSTQYGFNSNIILNDLVFLGGVIGMSLGGQQWVFKNITFIGCTTGAKAGGIDIVFTASFFQFCGTGIDASGTGGSLTLIDSSADNVGTVVSGNDSGGASNSIILENVQNSGNTVVLNGKPVLTGSVTDTWVHGNTYTSGNPNPQHQSGANLSTPRSSPLLSNGRYFSIPPPTYQEYSTNQFINIKSVPGLPVRGDGATDDTANINAILSQNAGCKIIYFPAGTYIVKNTIFVPAGSRIFGDAYASAISAVGSNFFNPNSPTTMVKVGNANEVGVAQISDMLFTVADVLQGCKLLEVNIAGSKPGDVGIWNSHFRVGGAAGSAVQTNCDRSPAECKAAWGLLHLTSSSSVYIENMWGWTADHDLDGGHGQTISVGRGALIEATKGTWLVGTGMEHNTLYQYNFNNAANVYTAMQQSETPYWQGTGNSLAPAPWTDNLIASDPNFGECGGTDQQCRMAFFERIRGSSNLFLYGGCVWVFFNGNGQPCDANGGICQQNAVRILNSGSTYLYGTNVHAVRNMVLNANQVVATRDANSGGWGGVVAAYLFNT